MSPPRFLLSLLARVVRFTTILDRGYQFFNRARSRFVLRYSPEAFFALYNDIAFANQDVYRPGTTAFRANLFSWERRLIDQHFPSPPATILVGAAGGGRESFELARLGYHVVAFEPVATLAKSMVSATDRATSIEVLTGRYEDLPTLRSLKNQSVDLRRRAPFDGSVLGWTSFSNVRSEEARLATLRQMGQLTAGPMLVSYFPAPSGTAGRAMFSAELGYCRAISAEEMGRLAEAADLDVVTIEDEGNWGCVVLRSRGEPKAGKAASVPVMRQPPRT